MLSQPDLAALELVPLRVGARGHHRGRAGRRRGRSRPHRELDRGDGERHPRHARVRHRPAHPARDRPPRLPEPVRPPGHEARRRPHRGLPPEPARAVPRVARQQAARRRHARDQLHRRGGRSRSRRAQRPDPGQHRHRARRRAVRPRAAGHRHRGPSRQRDPVRARRPRHPRAHRARQDDASSASSARTGPARCSAILQEFAARAINLTKLESRPTEARASATTASSSTSRATSPTSSSPTASATSWRSRPT